MSTDLELYIRSSPSPRLLVSMKITIMSLLPLMTGLLLSCGIQASVLPLSPIVTYASSYSAHAIDHSLAAPVAPLIAAPFPAKIAAPVAAAAIPARLSATPLGTSLAAPWWAGSYYAASAPYYAL